MIRRTRYIVPHRAVGSKWIHSSIGQSIAHGLQGRDMMDPTDPSNPSVSMVIGWTDGREAERVFQGGSTK